jgi:hypothetical protein
MTDWAGFWIGVSLVVVAFIASECFLRWLAAAF